ncbi:MAG: DUF4954 family protein [Bacteroides sp.]|nr:DUF4954 family protein [Bacteroides sp.]MCM1390166.1 DUF4954 family protein [Bacteroides sp.]
MKNRNLTIEEIDTMHRNGCTASDWNLIKVKDGFNASHYVRTQFSGNITLGLTDEQVIGTAGIIAPAGIYDAIIQNCSVGDNVHISRVNQGIINYDIEQCAYIAGVGSIICTGSRSFGNGTKLHVLNEQGNREVAIYDRLSAQIAYMLTFYRHDSKLIEKLDAMIASYALSKKSSRGRIGAYAKITNLGSATDVNFGEETLTKGTSLLWDGTISPRAFMGPNVIAEHFIVMPGGKVDKNSIIKNVFVGECAELSNGFVAENSLFFSNCVMHAGEAAAVFAGPHCVSMHKSTLLIGGYFSFFNAGSGTNQSNHYYRTGPVHQGIAGRGCKTSSNAYILWPARFGQFSLIGGSHYKHPDTVKLPYSYVFERNGKTMVIPGANVVTAGTIRDILKWKNRDSRAADHKRYDQINYSSLSPKIISRIYQAIRFLNDYNDNPGITDEYNFTINPDYISRGKQYYALAVDFFFGSVISSRLLEIKLDKSLPLGEQLMPARADDVESWADMAGLIIPMSRVDNMIARIKSDEINSLDLLQQAFEEENKAYPEYVWKFVVDNFKACYGQSIENVTPDDITSIIHRWEESVMSLEMLRRQDAQKDFAEFTKISYGIDGDENIRNADYDAVRGLPEKNDQLFDFIDHYHSISKNGYEAIARMKEIMG